MSHHGSTAETFAREVERHRGRLYRVLTPELAHEKSLLFEARQGEQRRILLALEAKYPGLRRNVGRRD